MKSLYRVLMAVSIGLSAGTLAAIPLSCCPCMQRSSCCGGNCGCSVVRELAPRLQASVCTVEAMHGDIVLWSGSGVFIQGSNGVYVFTANHVAREMTDGITPRLRLSDGSVLRASIEALGDEFNGLDVAILKVSGDLPEQVQTVRLTCQEVRLGDEVIDVGSPYGDCCVGTVHCGRVSFVDRPGIHPNSYFIQIDMSCAGGHSGSAVFNLRGEVCGILVMGQGPGIAYAVPARDIRRWLDGERLGYTANPCCPAPSRE